MKTKNLSNHILRYLIYQEMYDITNMLTLNRTLRTCWKVSLHFSQEDTVSQITNKSITIGSQKSFTLKMFIYFAVTFPYQ